MIEVAGGIILAMIILAFLPLSSWRLLCCSGSLWRL